MGELDKVVVEKLVEKGVNTTDWTLYRDDGWMITLDGLEDIPVIEDILQSLHQGSARLSKKTRSRQLLTGLAWSQS